MFERGKLVTSLVVRAAATIAGAAILTPFCAFGDSVPAIPDQISVTPGEPLTFVEGGKAQPFILTIMNISKPNETIGIKGVTITDILADGTDKADTIKPIPPPTTNCPRTAAKGLTFGAKCTFMFAVTPVADGPATEEMKKGDPDSGVTSVRLSVAATLGPPVSTTVDFTVNDVGFPPAVPEPATLTLLATGALGLAAQGRRKTTKESDLRARVRLRT
jgi:hypothetical protein